MKNLTVQELRDFLRDMPDDALVTVPISDGEIGTIDSVYAAKAKFYNGYVYPPNHYQGDLITIVRLE